MSVQETPIVLPWRALAVVVVVFGIAAALLSEMDRYRLQQRAERALAELCNLEIPPTFLESLDLDLAGQADSGVDAGLIHLQGRPRTWTTLGLYYLEEGQLRRHGPDGKWCPITLPSVLVELFEEPSTHCKLELANRSIHLGRMLTSPAGSHVLLYAYIYDGESDF